MSVPHADDEVLRLWATAHGLIALLAVGRVPPEPDRLTALLDGALDSLLAEVRGDDDEPVRFRRGPRTGSG